MAAPPAPPPPESPLSPRNGFRELRETLWTSLPIIIVFTSQTAMQFVDAVLLADYDENAMAAVTAAALAGFLLISFIIGLSNSVNTFVSQCIGAKRFHQAARYVPQAMVVALAYQIVCLPAILFATEIFEAFGHEGVLPAMEATYFRIVMCRVAATGCLLAVASFFIGMQRPVVPMITGITANLLNVAGDYVFISGRFGAPALGVRGAAYATLAATWIEMALLLVVFQSRWIDRRFASRSAWRVELAKIRELLRVGLPSAVGFVLDTAGFTVFVNLVVGGLGAAALAANGATSSMFHLIFMPVVGFSFAVTAVVGKHIGAGDPDGAERQMWLSMRIAAVFALVCGAAALLGGTCVLRRLFAKSADSELLRLGRELLPAGALHLVFTAMLIVLKGGLRGAGDTLFPAAMSIIGIWGLFIPLAFLLSHYYHLLGAWVAISANEAFVAFALILRLRYGAWRKIDIFRDERTED